MIGGNNDLSQYMYRIYNLDASLLLLDIKNQLVVNEISDSDVKSFIDGLEDNYLNPYDATSALYEKGLLFYKVPFDNHRYPAQLAYSTQYW